MRKQQPLLVRKFANFHRNNPGVWVLFQEYTTKYRAASMDLVGASLITSQIRWFHKVERRDADFKLNNNFAAAYARMYQKKYPEHEGMFRYKRSVFDAAGAVPYGE